MRCFLAALTSALLLPPSVAVRGLAYLQGGSGRPVDRLVAPHDATSNKTVTMWKVEDTETIFGHENVLHAEHGSSGSPLSAVLKSPILQPRSSQYWELAVPKQLPTLFVGITRVIPVEDPVRKGYGFRMLGYGGPGNLVDGGSALAVAWGPSVDSAKSLGVLAEYVGPKLNVYFYKDGLCLGMGFSLPESLFRQGAQLAVQLNGPGQLVYVSDAPVPTARENQIGFPPGVEGEWVIEDSPADFPKFEWHRSATLNVSLKEADSLREDSLSSKEAAALRVGSRAVNLCSVHYEKNEDGTWRALRGPICTMMAGPRAAMQYERRLNKFLMEAKTYELNDDGRLAVTDLNGVRIYGTRPTAEPQPVVSASWLVDE